MSTVRTGTGFALALVALGGAAYASSMTGTWLVESGEAHIEIAPCGEGLCGTVVWMLDPYDDRGNVRTDIRNPDETLRDRKVVGLTIMKVFPVKGKTAWKGTIYDANDGKTYKCSVEPQGENRIKFRGYLGIPLFGRTSHWTRVE